MSFHLWPYFDFLHDIKKCTKESSTKYFFNLIRFLELVYTNCTLSSLVLYGFKNYLQGIRGKAFSKMCYKGYLGFLTKKNLWGTIKTLHPLWLSIFISRSPSDPLLMNINNKNFESSLELERSLLSLFLWKCWYDWLKSNTL